MRDKNEQNARPKQGKILRARDIIPGTERTGDSDGESGAKEFDIPQFNLTRDLLSAQRRQIAFQRKGPEVAEDRGQKTEDRGPMTVIRLPSSVFRHLSVRDSIIAEIVARDIERLCVNTDGHGL
jgi:hypothetical protein